MYDVVEERRIHHIRTDQNSTRHRNAIWEGISVAVQMPLFLYEIIGGDVMEKTCSETYRWSTQPFSYDTLPF